MKNRIIVTLLLVCGVVINASAQNRLKLELSYNTSIPVGSFKDDYISKTSFRGGVGKLSYAINPKFAIGLQSGYQSYYQKYDRAVYKLDGNQTISAVVTNSMDMVPFLLSGTYFPLGNSATAKVQPYITAGAGINSISYSQYLGEFGGSESSTSFAAQGGLGIQIPVGNKANQTAIKIGGTYNYVSYDRNGVAGLNNIGASAGVVFRLK